MKALPGEALPTLAIHAPAEFESRAVVEKKTAAHASVTAPKASCVTGSPRLPAFMKTMHRIKAEVIVRFSFITRAIVQASAAMAARSRTTNGAIRTLSLMEEGVR